MNDKERRVKIKPAYEALMKVYPFGLDDLNGEQWEEFSDYEVSNFGRVKSFNDRWAKAKILKPSLTNRGYLQVVLRSGDKIKCFLVHRLVAATFIPNPESKPHINHLDGNKFNNHVSNLEWITIAENNQHAFTTGLMPQGEEHYNSKLTAEQVRFIRENPLGLNTYELGKMFGVNQSVISGIQLGKTYKTAGGVIRDKLKRRLPDQIREQIRAEYQKGVVGHGARVLARKYGLALSEIWRIVNNP